MQTANAEIEQILSPESNFIADIEKCIKANCEIIDCIIEWCFEKSVEFEQVVPLIKGNQVFKSKLTKEAMDLNFIKKKPRLKI